MPLISWDVETHPITDGCNTPKLVCVSSYDGETSELFTAKEGLARLRAWLLDPEIILIGHNLSYDLGVACTEDPSLLPLVFEAIEQNRIHDNQIRQLVLDNHHGRLKFTQEESGGWSKSKFDQASLVRKYTGRRPDKGAESVQARYNEVDGLHPSQYPQPFRDYAIGDSVDAFDVFQAQEIAIGEVANGGLPLNWRHTAHDWALHLASVRGFRTDPERTLALEAELLEEMAIYVEMARHYGFIRENGTKNEKATRAAIERYIEEPTRTKTGKVQLTREQLRGVRCLECGKDFDEHEPTCGADGEHIGLWAFSEVKRVEKKISTYVKTLKRGFTYPIHPRYNVIIETFRTSSSGPNIQNYPRSGGIRDCIVPRDGWVFAFCDLDTVEMATLGQVCIDLFGSSKIADAINAGKDLHVDFAAQLLQISYEECLARYKAKDPEVWGSDGARQFAKIANYGFAGGMGVDAFIDYAKTAYGMVVERALAERLHKAFREHWDLGKYFTHCANQIVNGECEYQFFERSGLCRGKVKYTAVCNGYFQHLAAMLAKDAMYFVTKECYAVPDSPLYGCRPWLFCHDEIGMEIPEAWIGTEAASAAARRLREIMMACAKHWCPDVYIGATVAMARNWLKGAEPLEDEHSNLVPVKKGGKDGKEWVHDAVQYAIEALEEGGYRISVEPEPEPAFV